MTFSKLAWETTQPIIEEICQHPFITELISGKLEQDRFAFYLQQDWMYLNDFAQALASSSLLAPSSREASHLIKFSHEVNLVEQELHLTYFRAYNIQKKAVLSPACFNYTNYLRATVARGNYPKALAALLPCFWVYQYVGQHIFSVSVPNNPYSDWISTYSCKEFADSVNLMIKMSDQAMVGKNSKELEEAVQIFMISTYFELQFWEDAYQKFLLHFKTNKPSTSKNPGKMKREHLA